MKNNGNNNGDISGILKELNDPILRATIKHGMNGMLPRNRAEAREQGEQSLEEMKKKAEEKEKELDNFRMEEIGRWLHDNAKRVMRKGTFKLFMDGKMDKLNSLGWMIGLKHEPMFQKEEVDKWDKKERKGPMPKPVPSSKVLIAYQKSKKRFVLFGQRLNVGEPVILAQQIFHWLEKEGEVKKPKLILEA